MGKCKKRTLSKSSFDYSMTRDRALNCIIEMIDRKNATIAKEAYEMISLFGISAEELSEAGAPYEVLKALGSLII